MTKFDADGEKSENIMDELHGRVKVGAALHSFGDGYDCYSSS
jgi:hypothetical protein